jgi:hypothetical protein
LKKSLILGLFLCITFYSFSKSTEEVPKNIKIISQSCSSGYMFLTVIDLDSNKVVILTYGCDGISTRLISCLKTGIKIDPNKQGFVVGTDAPINKK